LERNNRLRLTGKTSCWESTILEPYYAFPESVSLHNLRLYSIMIRWVCYWIWASNGDKSLTVNNE
jgi:hypothetical protein